MSRVLATYNIKGGVGKTSAAVNLSYLASRDGLRTLLWDLDPQGGSTYLFRVKPKVRGGGDKLVRLKSDVEKLIKGTDHPNLDLLPADFSYRHMDLALDRFKKPTRRLARVLEPLEDEYDWVFLDCPPSISLVSESVFEAADVVLVPIVPATLSSRTIEQLDAVVADARKRKVGVQVLAFFSMVDRRKKLHHEVMERLRAERNDVLETAIPASADVERMGVKRDAIGVFAPRGRAGAGLRGAVDRGAPARRGIALPDFDARPSHPSHDLLRGAPRRRPPRAAALQRRLGHERDAQVDPGEVRGRGGGADRQPRAARRGLRRDPRQGPAARRSGFRDRRCARRVRARVRRPGDQGERDLRHRVPAVHRARASPDRQARRRARARDRLRHDRPRLHRQGQRPGQDRGDDRHAGPRAQGDRAGALLADGPRGGGRLRARARHPGQGRDRGRAVLDRRQPVGAVERGPLDRGARPRARRRRLPARHAARAGARRGRGRHGRVRGRCARLAQRRASRTGRADRARRRDRRRGTGSGSSTTSRTGSSASRSATSTRCPPRRSC